MNADSDGGTDSRPQTPSLDALYREHAGSVARWAARLGGPSLDTEDLVQEVFVTAHGLLPSFRGEAKVTTWLYRITENIVRYRRRKERWRRLFVSSDEVLDALPSNRPTPLDVVERHEATRLVYRALDALPEGQRSLMILFELDGLSGEEIAELTGQKLGAIWVTLHRARRKFLARLQVLDRKARQ